MVFGINGHSDPEESIRTTTTAQANRGGRSAMGVPVDEFEGC